MSERIVHRQFLKNNSGADVKALTISSTSALRVVSLPVNTQFNTGFSALLLTFVSGTADLDVNFQVSTDGVLFYDPKTAASGTLTSAGVVVTGATQNEWIIYTPQFANWTRFILDADATGVWTAEYLHLEGAY